MILLSLRRSTIEKRVLCLVVSRFLLFHHSATSFGNGKDATTSMLVNFCKIEVATRFYRRNSSVMAAGKNKQVFGREELGNQTVTKTMSRVVNSATAVDSSVS